MRVQIQPSFARAGGVDSTYIDLLAREDSLELHIKHIFKKRGERREISPFRVGFKSHPRRQTPTARAEELF